MKSAYQLGIHIIKTLEDSPSDKVDYEHMECTMGIKWSSRNPNSWGEIIQDIIPITSNLLKKGILTNLGCSFRRTHLETKGHLVWKCKMTKNLLKLYFSSNVDVLNLDKGFWKPMEYWNCLCKSINKEDLGKFVSMMRYLGIP